MDAVLGLSSSPEQSMKLAEECARKALSLNPMEPKALLLVCRLSQLKKDHDKAIEYAEKAVKANPNNPYAFYFLGFSMGFVGRSEEAIANIRKAMRLTPHYPPHFLNQLAYNSFFLRRYDDALSAGEKILERCRKGEMAAWIGYILMVAIYSELGQEEKARKYAAEFLSANPNWTLQVIDKMWPYKDQSYLNRLLNAGRKAGLPDKPPLPLPDKPSIAVLPFVNMSDDPKQEYFSDGITEQIITSLSKVSDLFVIARTSSFKYKGKEVDVRRVGRDLGVRYVLEGSVQRSGDRLRITAQLVDAKSGNHVWAERYDRELKDIFALQDEITVKIISALDVKLLMGGDEAAPYWRRGTKNPQAYLKYIEAYQYIARGTPGDYALARKLAEEAIASDPEYPPPYGILAMTHILDFLLGTSKSPRESLGKGFKLAQKMLAMDESDARGHVILGNAYGFKREHEKAIAELKRALILDPNNAIGHMYLGHHLANGGRPQEAIPFLKKSMRLSPLSQKHASMCLFRLGVAYRLMGQYEEALSALKKAADIRPNFWALQLQLAATYIHLDREEEARAAVAEVRRIVPKFSAERFAKRVPFKNKADTERFIDALRKAGLK
jgi:TolB-like protein/Flp pilus assembly protein TadD